MLERAITLKEAIDELCFKEKRTDRLTDEEWELASQALKCLDVFSTFHSYVQGDKVSLAVVIPTVK